MKIAQIEIGHIYECKVSGRLVPVHVRSQRERWTGKRSLTYFEVHNLATSRMLLVSAARLRRQMDAKEIQ